MAWITPTLELCRTRITGAEWNGLQNAAKSADQDGEAMAQQVIDTQVQRIRGRVAACKENRLGAAGTIPDELQSAFLACWVYDFITRLPAMRGLLDEQRVRAWEAAERELRDAAACNIAIVPPAEAAPDTQQAAGPTVISNPGKRWASRQDLGGLF